MPLSTKLYGTTAALLLIPVGLAVALSGLWAATYVAHWTVDGFGRNHPVVLLVGVAAFWPAFVVAWVLPRLTARPWDLYCRGAWIVYSVASLFLIDMLLPLPAMGAQHWWWPLHYVVLGSVAAWPLRRQRRRADPDRIDTKGAEVVIYVATALTTVIISSETNGEALTATRLEFGMTSSEVLDALDDHLLHVTYAGDSHRSGLHGPGMPPVSGEEIVEIHDMESTLLDVFFEEDRAVRIDYTIRGFRED